MQQQIKKTILSAVLAVLALGGVVGLFWSLGKLEVKETNIVKAQSYTIEPNHPRIFFTSADLEKLRARCGIAGYEEHEEFGSHKAEYDNMVTTVNSWLGRTPEQMVNDQQRMNYSIAWAFIYAMTGNTTYSGKAREVMNWIVANDSTFGEYNPFTLARGFDWCYDQLTDTEKTNLRNKMIYYGDCFAALAPSLDAYHSGIKNLMALPELGLAMYTGVDDTKAKGYIDLSISVLQNRVIPSMEEVGADGSWHSGGLAYDVSSGYSLALDMLLDIKIGIGVDLSNFQHLKNGAYFFAHRLVDNTQYISGNDFRANGNGFYPFSGPFFEIAHLYQGTEQGRLAQWLAEQSDIWAGYYWKSIIFNDKGEALHPSNIPTERWFESGGIATMRSGWDLSDASTENLAIFRIEMYTSAHSNLHQGHFDISRGQDWLAIDAGYYDNATLDHVNMYRSKTFAHNSLIIDDQGQRVPGTGSSNDHIAYPDASTKCFRGLIGYGPDEDEPNADYVYSWGDITPAYDPTLLSNFSRAFVFLKPDKFVVFDRVSSANQSYSKKWLLHMVYQPQLGNGTWNGGVSPNAYEGTPGQISDNSDTYVITRGNSRLFVKTLLPEDHIVTRIGGPDSSGNYHTSGSYEAYVNGTNYPSTEKVNIERMGGWRIEVQPKTAQTDDIFLHVFETTDAGVTEMSPTTPMDSITNNMVGTLIADPSGPRIVMFSQTETKETGGLAENITYNISGTGTSKHLIVDLKPSTTFTVQNTNQDTGQVVETQTKTSSSQGTLYFETLLGSNHQITITLGTTPPPQVPNIILTKSVLVNGQPASEAAPGDELTYTITYANTGAGEAKSIVITDNIPNGTTYISGGDRVEQGVVYWNIPSLSAGGSGTASFRVRVE